MSLPILKRREVQFAGAALHSLAPPPEHGALLRSITSGSTGQPVLTLKTDLVQFLWCAFTLREDLWHRRDFSETLAAIRHTRHPDCRPPMGRKLPQWGASTADIIKTGPTIGLSLQATIEEQAEWLLRVRPGYLLTYPSAMRGLTEHFLREGREPPRLKGIKTFGEILESDCRALCERFWQAPIKDMYSTEEVGYIALQCPETNHYHVQAESVLVEILDENDRPCGPGEVGRVVVTTLHNFAMPLVRYDIGDYAEVGDACPCGRGLPLLRRIVGRQRNLLVMPDGRRKWPTVDTSRPDEFPAVLQLQLVQKTLEDLELRVVRPVPFTSDEVQFVNRFLHDCLGYPFRVSIQYVEAIPRSPSGKFEDFICEVSQTPLTSHHLEAQQT